MSLRREMKKLVFEARGRGWNISRTAGGHWRMTLGSHDIVVVSGTPGDRRGIRNARSAIRRTEKRLRYDINLSNAVASTL